MQRLCEARNCGPEREQVEALAHVLHVEVAVDLRGDGRVRVAEDALHGGQRDARLEQQGGGRVPQVMEAQRARERTGPELHAAARAGLGHGVALLHRVAAALASADLVVALHQPRASQGPAQHLVQRGVRRKLRAIRGGEQQLRGGDGHGLAEEGHQSLGDGKQVRVAALRRVARVRPGHHDGACREVHVRLAERQQFALTHPGVDRRGEQRAPATLQGREHQRDLLGLEILRELLRLLEARDGLGGIEAGEEAAPERQLEDAVEEGAQVVEGLRRQLSDLRVEQHLQA
ncbi:hypothetical protein M0222_17845 [Myxococcus fulvus]|nr:hypothetical protein [Myxococcus fulvus]MCK8499642.1 hypothetical protein [Myxococcus fulvus]